MSILQINFLIINIVWINVLLDCLDKSESNNSHDQNQLPKEYDGEPYVCPPELILPSDMILPEFDRQAAIIEKTAIFIARNNAQMEIVLKTKQSNNPQFKFLNYDDKLNPFYKELVKLIKSGRYIPRHRPNLDASKPEGGSTETDVSSVSKAFLITLLAYISEFFFIV